MTFLDYTGLTKLWDKIKSVFLKKSGDTMTGRLVTEKPISQVLIGTGIAAATSGSGSSTIYYPARWKFDLGIATPTAGDRIFIRTPVAGHDYGVFLSLDDGTTYYPVARSTGKNRLTTQYPNGSYACLVFEGALSGNTNCGCVDSCFPPAGATSRQNYTSGCWRIIGSYDSGNTVCQLRHENGRFYAGSTGCSPYSIVCLDKNNKFSMLVSSGSGTGTGKTINTAGKFKLSPVILYYSANNTAAANARVSSTYGTFNAYHQFDTRYSHNHTTTFAVDSPLYIECTIDEDGFWSPTTKCITQTLESGKYYIFLGMTYSTEYQAVLTPFHPLYYYDGTNLTEVPRLSKADRTKLDGIAEGATKVEASSNNGKVKVNGSDVTVYTHPGSGTNPHGTTKSDVGLANVGNFKAVSTVASQGLSDTEKSNARANIGAGTSSVTVGTGSSNAAAGNHTHKVKINGTEKTIAASNGNAVDLGTYLTQHQDITGKQDVSNLAQSLDLSDHPSQKYPSVQAVSSALGNLIADEFSYGTAYVEGIHNQNTMQATFINVGLYDYTSDTPLYFPHTEGRPDGNLNGSFDSIVIDDDENWNPGALGAKEFFIFHDWNANYERNFYLDNIKSPPLSSTKPARKFRLVIVNTCNYKLTLHFGVTSSYQNSCEIYSNIAPAASSLDVVATANRITAIDVCISRLPIALGSQGILAYVRVSAPSLPLSNSTVNTVYDFNDFIDTGVYRLNVKGTSSNKPDGVSGNLALQVMNADTFVIQTLYDIEMYYRTRNGSGTWSSWYKMSRTSV